MNYALQDDAATNIEASDVLPHITTSIEIFTGDTNQATIQQHVEDEGHTNICVELRRGSTPEEILNTLTQAADNLPYADVNAHDIEVEITLPVWAINALAADYRAESARCAVESARHTGKQSARHTGKQAA